jgi:hypothetical protein
MIVSSKSKIQGELGVGLLLGVDLTGGVGCQTFSLSNEDFQKQRRGEMIDPVTGEVVGVAGTVGYLGAMGAMVGEAIAKAVKK